jgi:predicted nucleic acid-binding protein
MIAATAVSSGFAVATRDLRSLPRIRELRVQRW